MPKIFIWNGYKFFFFSNEGYPLEPCHIHVRKSENIAKFWVDDSVILCSSWGMTARELKILEKIIFDNKELIRECWDEYFKL